MLAKIGIVTEFYYPLLGGITENVHNSARVLRDLGHDVRIITSAIGGSGSRNGDGNAGGDAGGRTRLIHVGRSVPLYANRSFSRITLGTRLAARMREVLREEKFDLLHIHSPLVPTLPALAVLEAKCPLVGTFHTYFERSVIYSAFRGVIQRKGMDRLQGQIGVSQSCIDSMAHYFRMDARVIPNGVDTGLFHPAAPRVPALDDGRPNLLFLGRFDPRNGLALMLKAFAIIRKRIPGVRLIVVGDGPLRRYHQSHVPKEWRDDLVFTGPLRDERPAYYASCDVFCSPVSKASFGVTLLEAMAAGRPIVATENVGYKEVMSPKEGIFVKPDDPEMFAKAVIHLLEDEPLREEMGRNGRFKALGYSWDHIGREIADYYREVLGATWQPESVVS